MPVLGAKEARLALLLSAKFATSVRFALAVNVYVDTALTWVPPSVQFTKSYPPFGVAKRLTTEPAVLLPPPLVEPPANGKALVVIV